MPKINTIHQFLLAIKVDSWPLWLRRNIIRAFVHRKKLTTLPFKTRTQTGILYQGDAADLIDYHVLSRGGFETGLSLLLRDWASRGNDTLFIDAGANSGLHSAYWSRCFQKGYAFEPLPANFFKLQRTLELNNVKNVLPCAIALGAEEKMATFMVPGSDNCGTGKIVTTDAAQSSQTLEVAVRTGDQMLEQEPFPIAAIKIDVEGYEAEVLAGFRERMRKDRPLIAFELLSAETDYVDKIVSLIPAEYQLKEIYKIRSKNYFLSTWGGGCGDIIAIPKEKAQHLQRRSRD